MKKLVIGLIIITLLICAIPFTIGFIVEKQVKEHVQSIAQNNGLKLSLSSYQRGWLSSTVNFNVEINKNMMLPFITDGENVLDFFVETTLIHGPFIGSLDNAGFGLIAIEMISSPIKLTDGLNDVKFTNNSMFKFDGVLEGVFSLLPIAGRLHDQTDFALDGLDIDYQSKLNYETTSFDDFTSTLTIAPLSINQSQQFNARVDQIIVSINGQLANQLTIENTSIKASDVSYKMLIENQDLSLENLDLELTPKQSNWLVGVNANLAVNDFSFNEKKYDQVSLDLTINDLMAAGMIVNNHEIIVEKMLEQVILQQLTVWELIQSRQGSGNLPFGELLKAIPPEVYQSIINSSLNDQVAESIPNPIINIDDFSLIHSKESISGSGWFYTDLFKDTISDNNESLTAFETNITMDNQQWNSLFNQISLIRESISTENLSADTLTATLKQYLTNHNMLNTNQDKTLSSNVSFANGVIKLNNKPLYLAFVENNVSPSE